MQFCWRPYRDNRIRDIIPEFVEYESQIWTTRSPLICYAILEWHPTDRVRRQFGLVQPVPRPPRSLGNSHNRELGRTGNWENNHARWIERWERRSEYVLPEGEETMTYVMSETYWAWYRRLAGGVIYLSESYRRNRPEDARLPPRFPQPWVNPPEQVPLENLLEVPGYVHVPVQQPPHFQQVMYGIHDLGIQQDWVPWEDQANQPPEQHAGWDQVGGGNAGQGIWGQHGWEPWGQVAGNVEEQHGWAPWGDPEPAPQPFDEPVEDPDQHPQPHPDDGPGSDSETEGHYGGDPGFGADFDASFYYPEGPGQSSGTGDSGAGTSDAGPSGAGTSAGYDLRDRDTIPGTEISPYDYQWKRPRSLYRRDDE